MSENELAGQIIQEFRCSETLAIDISRLNSLFALLGQLGWSIASQDSRHRNRYNLHGQALTQFDTEHIPRIQLLAHLNAQPEKRYLHESSQLVIWRNQVLNTFSPEEGEEETSLTKRESEIYTSLLDGLTLPEIAQELGISTRTVEKHIQNIYKKKGVHSYNELLFRSD